MIKGDRRFITSAPVCKINVATKSILKKHSNLKQRSKDFDRKKVTFQENYDSIPRRVKLVYTGPLADKRITINVITRKNSEDLIFLERMLKEKLMNVEKDWNNWNPKYNSYSNKREAQKFEIMRFLHKRDRTYRRI